MHARTSTGTHACTRSVAHIALSAHAAARIIISCLGPRSLALCPAPCCCPAGRLTPAHPGPSAAGPHSLTPRPQPPPPQISRVAQTSASCTIMCVGARALEQEFKGTIRWGAGGQASAAHRQAGGGGPASGGMPDPDSLRRRPKLMHGGARPCTFGRAALGLQPWGTSSRTHADASANAPASWVCWSAGFPLSPFRPSNAPPSSEARSRWPAAPCPPFASVLLRHGRPAGCCRQQDVRATEIDKVVMYDCFRCGQHRPATAVVAGLSLYSIMHHRWFVVVQHASQQRTHIAHVDGSRRDGCVQVWCIAHSRPPFVPAVFVRACPQSVRNSGINSRPHDGCGAAACSPARTHGATLRLSRAVRPNPVDRVRPP